MNVSSLLLAALILASVNPANAAPRTNLATPVSDTTTTGSRCSGGAWPSFGGACRNFGNWANYNECLAWGAKAGWRGTELWWYCSSVGLKQ